MRSIRWRFLGFALLLLVAIPGCGGGCTVERGKNSDLDRPKAQVKLPEKR